MSRTLLVSALIAIVLLAVAGMRHGWNARVQAQSDIPVPHDILDDAVVAGPWSAHYLGATYAERWLDRVDAHGLGARSNAGVRADKALAGRAYEEAGIIVLTTRLGHTPIDIGLRFPDTTDHLAALAALAHREAAL